MRDAGDGLDRAGRYVLGMMDAEERERAEHDLEVDPAFRLAMVEVAERLHVIASVPEAAPADQWQSIKERLGAMPQMRSAAGRPAGAPPAAMAAERPVNFGRRRTDAMRPQINPQRPPVGIGAHSVPSVRALVLALCLIAVFAAGYLMGIAARPL